MCNMKQLVRETGDREREGEGVEAGEAGVGTGVKVGERDRDGRGGRGGDNIFIYEQYRTSFTPDKL